MSQSLEQIPETPLAPHEFRRRGALVGVAVAAALLAACASLPDPGGRAPSQALANTADTRLGRALAPGQAQHPGDSVFYPLPSGPDAFVARLALARGAERSLDLQYYIFDPDLTGKTLLAAVIAAADRGVRVRLLLDDLHLSGQDRALAAIDAHPNIEVRLFNPFARRNARWLEFATDFRRLDRRMHNKSMTADNQLTVVGGRNIGDGYFSADTATDFSDLDVLAGGPVVRQVSAVFDDYWNGPASYPVPSLIPEPADAQAEVQALRQYLDEQAVQAQGGEYAKELLASGMAQALEGGKLPAYWGRGTVLADEAIKVTLAPQDDASHAIPKLARLLDSAQRDLALVSPYFVPDRNALEWLAGMARRGVRVRILTNSFAATDVSAVHAGYAPTRRALLAAGIELYELKPSAYAELAREGHRSLISKSRASLHAKSYMVDGHLLFVGSLNLDPRSARLNTEMGVVLDSAALCAQLGTGLDDKLLDVAYKVMLEPGPAGAEPELVWVTREDGLLRTYDSEPGMSALQHVGQSLLRLLPLQDEL
ncbi:phospholipase D family protein [Cupriavidus basilensis]|uniref:phospholipase D family protein n=1 Tax=Cupriavidus basilensis TaxID=68895 RepID=UPI0028513410|nr:phospholipase D family protein [Cupriavidus basilensis]MDR3383664.1 phospholipase D family protein [Cupriavidus basilensis]